LRAVGGIQLPGCFQFEKNTLFEQQVSLKVTDLLYSKPNTYIYPTG